MDAEYLTQVIEKLKEKGLSLEQIEQHTKIPAQLLKLYSVGGMVPGRIVKKLESLIEA